MRIHNRLTMGLAAVALVASLTGCQGNAGAALAEGEDGNTTVRIVSTMTFNSGLSGLLVYGDIAEEQRLNFETVTIADAGSSNQVAALLSGSADVASLGINSAIDAIAGGADLQIIGGASVSQQTLVASNEAIQKLGVKSEGSPIQRTAQLRGATIAVGPEGSAGNFTLRAILTNAGLDPNADVNLVPLADSAGAVAAGLENGTYDATFGPIGSGEAAVLRGKAETILSVPAGDADVLKGNINSVFVTSTRLIEQQPDLVQRMRESFRAAADLVAEKPDEARAIIREKIYPNMEEALFESSWQEAKLGYPEDATYDEENWKAFVRIFDQFSPNDYASLKFNEIVNSIATK